MVRYFSSIRFFWVKKLIMNNNKTYTSLEPSYKELFGAPSFDTSQVASLFTSTSFLYSMGIMLCVVAAGIMYMRAGAIRMQASERAVTKSNEEIKRVTIGLVGVLSLFVIIYTFNKDLLTGEVGLKELAASRVMGSTGALTSNPGTSGTSVSCANPQSVISSLSSQGGICSGARCTVLSGCNYTQYESIIRSEAQKAGVKESVVIALMCKESRAQRSAQNRNPNGTYDCGLMQVNQSGPCGSDVLDPATNISRGVALIKQKMTAASQVYPNIPSISGMLASYNCCANGTVPNAPSADCTQAAGFPYTIPKWACPINPGEGQFNMCTVKNYVCELNACIGELES